MTTWSARIEDRQSSTPAASQTPVAPSAETIKMWLVAAVVFAVASEVAKDVLAALATLGAA